MIHSFANLLVGISSLFFFSIWISFLGTFVVAKALTWDSKLPLKEILYFLLASFIWSLFVIMPYVFSAHNIQLGPTFPVIIFGITRAIPAVFLFIYFRKLKSYSVKKAIILTIFSHLISFVAYFSAIFVFHAFFDMPLFFSHPYAVFYMLSKVFSGILSLIFAIIVLKTTINFRKKINANTNIQTVLMAGSLISWVTFEVLNATIHFIQDGTISLWVNTVLLGYVIATVSSFLFYSSAKNSKSMLQQKEAEQRSLLFYTNEIEQHQSSIRKFKHDYQNILLSLEGFFEANDLSGAKECYYTQIKTVSEIITKDNFTLDRLSKIKMLEIKGFLVAKLMVAQSDGIDTSVEVETEIDHISLDSVTLVRMLGIILDNAIEELRELGTGKLAVACYKSDESVTFVVQNTCRLDIPSLYELEQYGFSTKGDGRGLGLSNLAELVTANASQAALQTSIADGKFTQKLRIGGVE